MGLDWSRDPKEFICGAHYQAIVSVKQANNLVVLFDDIFM